MFATKWKHEEKSCRDTLATVHDSYNSVFELGSSSSSISTTVVQARNVSCRVNVLMETQKRQRGDSFATIGGGGKGPFRGTVFVFLKLVRSVDTKLIVANVS